MRFGVILSRQYTLSVNQRGRGSPRLTGVKSRAILFKESGVETKSLIAL